MILQNVLVLFVDRGRTDANGGQGGATTSISLEVKPEQTELVKAAERSGTLNVTLRPVQSAEVLATQGVTERELTGGQAAPDQPAQTTQTPVLIIPPSSPSRPKSEITIIRATEERTITP
jgi:Flp pilus assembly protein CpaB